jgi:putative transcriptional regulator
MSASKAKAGSRMAQARRSAGLSQSGLADRLSDHRTTIGRIERGEVRPSVDLALAICRELGESVETLFGGGR